jgi:hypothetical protein
MPNRRHPKNHAPRSADASRAAGKLLPLKPATSLFLFLNRMLSCTYGVVEKT